MVKAMVTPQNLEFDGETDLSTQQDRAQAPSRLPRSHGDRGWTQGSCRSPRAGPQEAFGL